MPTNLTSSSYTRSGVGLVAASSWVTSRNRASTLPASLSSQAGVKMRTIAVMAPEWSFSGMDDGTTATRRADVNLHSA